MILLHRPIVVYDVDAVAAVVLLALLALGYFGVVEPAEERARLQNGLQAQLTQLEAQMGRRAARLRALEEQVGQLQKGVAAQRAAAPRRASLAATVQGIVALAESCGLRVAQVAPQTGRETDHHLADFAFSARGYSLDFLRFLDQLARDNPHCSVLQFAVAASAQAEDAACNLSWTLRLRMLSDEPAALAGRP